MGMERGGGGERGGREVGGYEGNSYVEFIVEYKQYKFTKQTKNELKLVNNSNNDKTQQKL